MKIIFLNTWSGQVGQVFFDFFDKNKTNTDIFCLQEVDRELSKKLNTILSDFNGYSFYDSLWDGLLTGKTTFIRKGIKINNSGKVLIHKKDEIESAGYLQYLKLEYKDNPFLILNVHGKTLPGTKLDTPEKINQSNIVIKTACKYGSGLPIIIGGDFNLFPETLSIKKFEEAGYINLIKEWEIKTTRNKLSWEQPGNTKQLWADYVFVTQNVNVKSFEVPEIEISDHNPMILDIGLS